ncbi:MAG: tetratricopeptide repeat protein, partial [Cyanobacteria bacterium J06639_1]
EHDCFHLQELLREECNTEKIWSLAKSDDSTYRVAIPALERIIEIDPDNIDAITYLGTCQYMIGEDERAREMLDLAKSKSAEIDVSVLLLEAFISDDRDRQIHLCRQVLEIDSTNETALENLKNWDEID